jgi:ABC-type Fe3+ transport system substrate-binding protein
VRHAPRRLRLALLAIGLAAALGGCGSDPIDGPGGFPIPLTVAVSAPLRSDLAPIVRQADPAVRIVTLPPNAPPPRRTDVVLAITATDFPSHMPLMAPDFNDDSFAGRLGATAVAFGVAPGNPLDVHRWRDLLNPGVRVAIADPLAPQDNRLEVLAAATTIVGARHHNAPAREFVARLFRRAEVAPTETAALNLFATGDADVVVSTESHLLEAQAGGVALTVVYPPTPMPITIAAGVGIDAARPKAAQGLVDALHMPGPQKALARAGLRPVLVSYAPPDRFPVLPPGHTPAILGKSDLVTRAYFGPDGVVAQATAKH